ncbi:MAG: hypothetical protein K2P81_11370 [Bacteriovoracaceae bacterium]|nr:hypothetical protein [Bacteriovoracaceae bacterium]
MQSLRLFIVLISGFLSFASLAEIPTKKIVVLYSYPKGEWYYGIQRGIQDTLGKYAQDRYKFFDYLYDYEGLKFKSKKAQSDEIERIVKEVLKIDPDYIVINDDEAVEKFIDKFPKTKSVILNAINQQPVTSLWAKGRDITQFCGVVEHYPIEESLRMISLMVKDVRQMSVVSSEGDSSKIVSKIFEELKSKKTSEIKVREIYLKTSWDDWKTSFREINTKDQLAWILVPYEVFDKNGKQVSLDEMANWIKSNMKIPLLGILSIHTKMGFLAAISVDPYGLGKQAAEIIIQIEKGDRCSQIGFAKSKYHSFEVNTDEVKRLGLKVPDSFIGVAKFVKTSQDGLKR